MDFQLGIYLIVLSVIIVIHSPYKVHGMQQSITESCNESTEVCEFYWTVEHSWTMMAMDEEERAGKGIPVVVRNGTFYERLVKHFGCDNFEDMREGVSQVEPSVGFSVPDKEGVKYTDGRYTLIYTINNEYPGPNIVVHEGQTVVVHVTNELINEGLTFHWHGLEQRGTPYMDGVPMVTQCPINVGETFTYKFKADAPGTRWYHSHHGLTRNDGLYGAIVILPRKKRSELPEVQDDFLMMVQDFYHDIPSLVATLMQKWSLLFYQRGFDSDECMYAGRGVEGDSITTQIFDSALINGKGHKIDENTGLPVTPQIPLEEFLVEKDKYYRFRIINTGMTIPFRISIDGHPLSVVASDGNDIRPIEVESVIVHNGESFDVLIHTNQSEGKYWIRAETLAVKEPDGETLRHPEFTYAILSYNGTGHQDVESHREECTKESPCRVLNCHYGQESPDIMELHQHCLDVSNMQATESDIRTRPLPMPSQGDEIEEMFLNFHFREFSPFRPSVNGKSFVSPSSPLLFQDQATMTTESNATSCQREECALECDCQHVIKVKKGQILQIIMDNSDDQVNGMTHPIHLHGQSFHVLKVAYPSYDPDNGNVKDINPDISFSNYYTQQQWKNSSWHGNNIPGLNLKNPPRKDVITIPRKGYVVIRFRADNPGFWFMHCHKETHLHVGMALVLQIGELSDMPALQEGLPLCVPYQSQAAEKQNGNKENSKNLSSKENVDGLPKYASTGDEAIENNQTLHLSISAVLVALALIELGVIVYMKKRQTKEESSKLMIRDVYPLSH